MVRIKVYRLSQVLAAAIVALLAIVLAVLLAAHLLNGQDTRASSSQAVVEVAAAFSAVDPVMPPAFAEDERTDDAAGDIIVEVIHPEEAQAAARPRVLIYHTHTHEAYEQVADDPYQETETWRTADQEHSVVRVGEALTELLTQRGLEVVHDVTDHEMPHLNTAYTRSLQTLESYAGEHFDLYIDLHRDAYNASLADYVEIDGQQMAQLMMLIGNGGDYEVKPDYEANLRFATLLTGRINEKAPGLCREVMVKNGRYNQHIGTPSVLIEVGHNKNTLQQALASMPILADSLAAVLMSGT